MNNNTFEPIPFDGELEQVDINHKKLGTPSCVYTYQSTDLKLVTLQRRFEDKQFIPLSHGSVQGKIGWHNKAIPHDCPLYGLVKLTENLDLPVLIVEGEKAVEAAQKLLPNFVVVTSYGGANRAQKSDWSPISGRDVVIWPDNDKQGFKYSEKVASICQEIGVKSISIVDIPDDLPEKWDLADTIPTNYDADIVNKLIAAAKPIGKEQQFSDKVYLWWERISADPNHRLVINQSGHTSIQATIKDQIRFISIDSEEFSTYLIHEIIEPTEKFPSKQNIEKLKLYIRSQSLMNRESVKFSSRIAKLREDIVYDLGDQVIKINKSGWSLSSSDGVCFHRNSLFLPQVKPATGGSIADLCKFINLADADAMLLLMVWVISAFAPSLLHPILVVHGQQGSSKSTLTKMLVDLIDPRSSSRWGLGSIAEMEFSLPHRRLVDFDNVSKISASQSDFLCKVVTGTSSIKRKLYTDSDVVINHFDNIVILNSIVQPIVKPDLLDRAIAIKLDPIPESSRICEEDVVSSFDAKKSAILGAIFDTLVNALRILPTIEKNDLLRMAGFHHFGRAVAISLGEDPSSFDRAYRNNQLYLAGEALEECPVAVVIRWIVKERGRLYGNPSECLAQVKQHWEVSGADLHLAPRSAQSFGHELTRIQGTLEKFGYMVKRQTSGNRIIEITNDVHIAQTPTHQGDVTYINGDVGAIENGISPS